MLKDQKALDYFSTEVVLVKVNAEVDTSLARLHKISGYPTGVLLGTDGKEIDRISGYAEVDEFLKIITDYRNGIGTLDDLLNKVEAAPDRLLSMEIAEKYKYRGGPEEARKWYGKVIESGEPSDSVSGEAQMSLADMSRRAKDYDDALAAYEAIQKEFSGQMFATDAEIWIAIVYKQAGDTAKAITKFEGFIKSHPESHDVEYAQKQIKKLKGTDSKQSGN